MFVKDEKLIYDNRVLVLLNKNLKKYKTKLKFQYYDISPFKIIDDELLFIILKHVDIFKCYYSKIFILSSLGNKQFYKSIPYLVNVYEYFVTNLYKEPKDEIFMLHLCETIRKIECPQYIDLYKRLFEIKKTPSFESIIIMLKEMGNIDFEDDIFNLIFKENIIPLEWIGLLNEDEKYWCSYIAFKYIVNCKDEKYLTLFENVLKDDNYYIINFSNSKYKKVIEKGLRDKYKKLSEKGIKLIKSKKN